MAITDYIPNVFGSATPSTYESLQTMGLLTPQQVEQQQKTANIQGLLGAGLALAQGMSRTGPRRSAAENILGALAGGFGAAGGAYQQGLQNVVQKQQLQSAALQQQQGMSKLRSIAEAKAKYPDLAPLFDIDAGKAMEQVIMREDAKLYGLGGTPTQGQDQMPAQALMQQTDLPSALSVTPAGQTKPAQTVPMVDPANVAKATDYRQKAAFAYSRGNEKLGKFFTDEADRLDPKETFMFRDGKMVSTKRGLVGDFGGTKQLNPDEARARGLDPARGIWMLKGDGTPQLIEGTKPNARLLTAAETTEQGLPTDRGQVYQIDSNGKIDLVQGTMVDKEKFTGEYANLANTMFGTSDINKLSPTQRKQVDSEAERRGMTKAEKSAPKIYTGDLSKTTAGQVEQGALSNADAITRLNNIQYSYKPEYQNIKYRANQAWKTLVDKGIGLPEQEKRQLAQYSQYKQNSLQNLNQTIKDITGAAMGVQEAERIIASLPNAGTGIFDGDSPTEFEAKLNNAVKQTKYALARKNYALKNGLKWENTSLDSMPKIIQNRGKEIEKQYNLDPKDPATKQTVLRQLAAEFGVAFQG